MPAVIVKADEWDGWGYWPNGIHNWHRVVDFTAIYSSKTRLPPRRFTWFLSPNIDEAEMNQKLQDYAIPKKIVVVTINKIWEPPTPAVVRMIKAFNLSLEKERRRNENAA